MTDNTEKWVIVRWDTNNGKRIRCGAVSPLGEYLQEERERAGLSRYGFPGGRVGCLEMYESPEEAQEAIDSGKYSSVGRFSSCCNDLHTVEPLSSIRFRVTEGPYTLGTPRRLDVTGTYWECVRAIGLAYLKGQVECVRLMELLGK